MKKLRNSDGYVLVYLLVIITVMGLFSATLMSSTIRVMQNQQTSIQQMKDQYAAQGEIEKKIATFEKNTTGVFLAKDPVLSSIDGEHGAKNSAITNLANRIFNDFNIMNPDRTASYDSGSYVTTFKFDVEANQGSTKVVASLAVSFEIAITQDTPNLEDGSPGTTTYYGYRCQKTSFSIDNYEISSVTPAPEGGAPA